MSCLPASQNNFLIPSVEVVKPEDVFVHVDQNFVILKRSLEVSYAGNTMTLENLDLEVDKLPKNEQIENISCPINSWTKENHKDCAVAYPSKDRLTTFIKCSCPKCTQYNVLYKVESRFGAMENYIRFQSNHALIEGSNGATFYKIYDDDEQISQLACMKKEGAKDAWADKTDNVSVVKRNSINLKPINPVDIAIKGIKNCMNMGEKIEDPRAINFGKSMKRFHKICFKPNKETVQELNLWQGFPFKPKANTIKPFLNFLFEAVGQEEGDHILDFFAHMIQKPQEKPRFCLVFKGAKGTGKNTVEEALGKDLLYARNYYRTSQPAQFFGKFNFHIAQNILSVLQELKWDEKSDYDSILKDMITETSRSVEQKYMDQVMLDNYSRIVITTNEDWAVPARGREERRYCVISFPEKKTEDLNKKIKAFYAWKESNPVQAIQAIMYFLENRDLLKYSIDKAPETKGLIEQKTLSLQGVEKFIFDALSNGYFGNINKKGSEGYGYLEIQQKNRIKRAHLYGCFQIHFPKERISAQKFHKKMGDLIDSYKVISNGAWTEFKDLQTSIKSFEEETGVKVHSDVSAWES